MEHVEPDPLPPSAPVRRPSAWRRLRPWLVRVHRWLGLATAAFLFVTGATGAVIAWEHELDAALAPAFYEAASPPGAPTRSALELADRFEAAEPRARVTYLPLGIAPGHALTVGVAPRTDATDAPSELGYSQVALDPATGRVQAKRLWGRASLAREDLLPFLYTLHDSLVLPDVGGRRTGALVLGLVAIAWTIDAFVALAIAFPSARAWRSSLHFRLRSGGARLVFDLHRSGGVWTWALLLMLAVSAVSMTLGDEVVRPLVGLVSPLTPDPFDRPVVTAEPALSRAEVVELARAEGVRRGFREPPGAVYLASPVGLYGVGFFAPGDDHGDGGLGNPWLWLDAADGRVVGATVPGEGSVGDVFLQAQFPLHSGRILGTAGRALVSALGVVVATLSATGVVLWARRRRWRGRA